MASTSPALPIDDLLPIIVEVLDQHGATVIVAAPGAGKTTRVPQACLDAPFLQDREVWVLEPRRLAAKMAALRVAAEQNETIGHTVGYHFRFENVGSAATRIRFLTEGTFLRQLMRDPHLERVGAVLIDEFHERSLHADLALALLKRLQAGKRPDLRLAIMSATLDGATVARYLGDVPELLVEARPYPVAVEYLPPDTTTPLEKSVMQAVRYAIDQDMTGDMLVFLPGVAEIRRCQQALAKSALGNRFDILPLYADLSRDEQERAVLPGRRQKVVLATNVAETSLTIEGVCVVIDSGLARIPSHNWWSGLPILRLAKISQASATQRAGRAGRTGPGLCLRLYSKADFLARPRFEIPAIEREDLAGPLLALKALGIHDAQSLDWFSPPTTKAVEAAEALIHRLGATDANGQLTPLGQRMATLPTHPRLARLAIAAADQGIAYEGCTMAAFLAEVDQAPDNEVGQVLGWLLQGGDRRSAVARSRAQLLAALNQPNSSSTQDATTDPAVLTALRKSLLAAFPDRVGRVRFLDPATPRRRGPGQSAEVVLCGGGAARLLDPHLPPGTEYVIALDVEERTEGGLKGDVRLRLVAAIEPDWLLETDPSAIEERVNIVWNAAQQRVEAASQWAYGRLVLSQSPVDLNTAPHPLRAKAEAELLRQVRLQGMATLVDPAFLERWRVRLTLAAHYLPEMGFVAPSSEDEQAVLQEAVQGCLGLDEVRARDILAIWASRLGAKGLQVLDEAFPIELRLPSGRRLFIHYESGKPPWAASRLQDFLGMTATPTLARGRLPLVLHLLAPNQRTVQVTTDLASFWSRTYPELRGTLSRRYPKHKWPENPLVLT